MRALRRWMLAVIVLALLLAGLWYERERLTPLPDTAGGVRDVSAASASVSYELRPAQALEFPVSGSGEVLRILSHALIDEPPGPTPVSDDAPQWRYALDYALLDTSGKVVFGARYHHRTKHTEVLDEQSGEVSPQYFVLQAGVQVSDARVLPIPLAPDTQVARVRLRLAQADARIQALLVKVYQRDRVASYKLPYMWQRLSQVQREDLARDTVYGADLLRESETQNLMRNRWRPLGPAGAQDVDYLTRTLYHVSGLKRPKIETQALRPQGLLVDAPMHGVIPIPRGETRIGLRFLPLPGTDPGEARALDASPVLLRWYGRTASARRRFEFDPRSAQVFEAQLDGGLLEIVAPGPWIVRAFAAASPDSPEQNITPAPLRLRTYRPDADRPLVYRIDHVGTSATPLRVDLRRAVQTGAEAGAVHYELLDAKQVVIGQGVLASDPRASLYDRESERPIGEPARHYFKLPARVAMMRLSAGGDVLVSAYTRPADLPRRSRLPEDTFLYERDQGLLTRMPGWFVLKPENEKTFLRALQSVLVDLQHRPAEEDPLVLSGQYAWETYQPRGTWRARDLLLPREAGLELRDEARVSVYRALSPNRSHTLALRALPGEEELRPILVYEGGSGRFEARVLLDERTVREIHAEGAQGQYRLPRLRAGKHRLRIEAPQATRWYINYAEGDEASRLRRLATRLGRGGLEFVYTKRTAQEEVLSAQIFTRDAGRKRLRLRIDTRVAPQLAALGGWTFDAREIDVLPEYIGEALVLDTASQRADYAQRFFIPLDRDLPPGDYRIRIDALDEGPEYLSLYRLIPGRFSQRRLFQESLQ